MKLFVTFPSFGRERERARAKVHSCSEKLVPRVELVAVDAKFGRTRLASNANLHALSCSSPKPQRPEGQQCTAHWRGLHHQSAPLSSDRAAQRSVASARGRRWTPSARRADASRRWLPSPRSRRSTMSYGSRSSVGAGTFRRGRDADGPWRRADGRSRSETGSTRPGRPQVRARARGVRRLLACRRGRRRLVVDDLHGAAATRIVRR